MELGLVSNVNRSRRSIAKQEVLVRITLITKLGHFEVINDFFQVNVLQLAYLLISLNG